jgi:PAS domain S-box-containing protein
LAGNLEAGGEAGAGALRALLDEIDRGLLIADPSGRIEFANREAARIAGFDQADVVGRSIWSVVKLSNADGTPVELSLQELPSSATVPSRRVALLQRTDASAVAVEFALCVLPAVGRAASGVALILWERSSETAAAAARDSEERFTVALKGAKVIVSTQDTGLRYIWIKTPYGGEAEVLGKTDMELLSPEDGPRLTALKERVLAEGITLRQEFDASFGGRRYWYDLTLEPQRDAQGRQVGVTTVAVDITRRKLLEQQLREAQKMEAVGRLAGGIAHDFNNMLAVIMSYSALALETLAQGDPLRGEIEAIQRAAEHAASLTRQLLAYGRRQMLSPEVLDINTVVQELAAMLSRTLGEDIAVELVLQQSLWPVRVDRVQLEQVIVNLAVNARDAMPKGGRLTIETSNVELDEEYATSHWDVFPGNYVLLAMTDTGHGMDEATRALAFEPFFTTKPPGTGTGLGLSTVQGIVRQSGGNIWLYSEVGRGTTVKVYLPRVQGAVPSRGEEREVYSEEGGSETILLVEDDPAVRQATTRILTSAGYRVLATASPVEALALLAAFEGPVHLLLSDVVLPQMSGRELAQQVQAAHPGVKVLYMSGYTKNAIVHSDELPSDVKFIAKPFKAAELRRAVRQALGREAP